MSEHLIPASCVEDLHISSRLPRVTETVEIRPTIARANRRRGAPAPASARHARIHRAPLRTTGRLRKTTKAIRIRAHARGVGAGCQSRPNAVCHSSASSDNQSTNKDFRIFISDVISQRSDHKLCRLQPRAFLAAVGHRSSPRWSHTFFHLEGPLLLLFSLTLCEEAHSAISLSRFGNSPVDFRIGTKH